MKTTQTVPPLPLLLSAILLMMVTGCHKSLPTEPITQLPPPHKIRPATYGVVVSPEGRCLGGARVELLDGAGRSAEQGNHECDIWGLDEATPGFVFYDLVMGTSVTLRASMPGYEPQTFTAIVEDCCHPASIRRVTLKKLDSARTR